VRFDRTCESVCRSASRRVRGRTNRQWWWFSELTAVDPTDGTIIQTVPFNARPEGIALAPDYIWWCGVVLDRNTLEVVHEPFFGFAIARDPDGSIWELRGR
jgi:hypothetical protein